MIEQNETKTSESLVGLRKRANSPSWLCVVFQVGLCLLVGLAFGLAWVAFKGGRNTGECQYNAQALVKFSSSPRAAQRREEKRREEKREREGLINKCHECQVWAGWLAGAYNI